MFENLTGRLSDAARRLSGKGRLTEANIKDTLREVRLALLEADVALPVVKSFIDRVRDKALGEEVMKSLTMLNEVKPLSYRERKMLDRAKFLLVSELSEASGKNSDQMEGEIDKALENSLQDVQDKVEH